MIHLLSVSLFLTHVFLSPIGVFPEPEKDRVIQIANMVIRQGEHEPFIRNVFTLDTCAPVIGSHVLSYMSEKEMLAVSHCYVFFSVMYRETW